MLASAWGMGRGRHLPAPPSPAPPSPARWSSDSGVVAQAAPDFSVDLTPEQATAFVEFVSLLADVEASGTSMVHLAQAAVDQAGAQLKAAEEP